ncbi:hypothetical protein CUMW_013770 [Citrus unshiu]|nr:hypothetical protein CUMW_013770 [Citrus unshiu]
MDSVSVYEDAIGRSTSHVPPADYIVRIKSYSLLAEEAIVEKYESGAFQARGHKRQGGIQFIEAKAGKKFKNSNRGRNKEEEDSSLFVCYNTHIIKLTGETCYINKSKNVKDHISLYLAVADTSSLTFGWEVYAVFCLFLLYQNQDSYLVVQDAMGKERRFNGVKLEWGFDQFIPLEAFNDASNGYLVDDTCVFGAEVFVKERNIIKGECLSMANITSSCKFVWMGENFSKLDERRQESQVSGLRQSLVFERERRATLAVKLGILVLDATAGKGKLRRRLEERRRFNGLKLEWGFDQFIPLEAFNDASNGYPVDDTCVFGAEFVWMVENFSKLDERRQESQIVLYPMGNGCGDGDHLSLFLAFEDSTLEAIKVYARYTLRILDQVGAKHKSFQDSNWFLTPESSWGWPRFVSLSAQ